jgi:phage terminase small subunit
MTALANTRHERFACAVASGEELTAAHERAGYSRSPTNARRLSRRPTVRARVAELQKEIAMEAKVTAEQLIGKLFDIVAEARQAGQFAAASASIERIARIAGLWESGVHINNAPTYIVQGPDVDDNTEEWEAKHRHLTGT